MRYHVLVREPCSNKMVTVVVDSDTRMAAMNFADAKTFGGAAVGVKEGVDDTKLAHGSVWGDDLFFGSNV